MAFVTNESETLEVKVIEEKEINEYRIHAMNIRIDPNDPTALKIAVDWSKGYIDADQKYVYAHRQTNTLEGGPILSAVTTAVTDGNTRYDEIKNGIWETLMSEGLVPAGTIQ